MSDTAWVTLATNDTYSLGALVLANSLRAVGTKHHLTVLITPGVTEPMRGNLASVFNTVQEVNILDSKDEANLRLLKRPELGITFTKLHCWKLTQFKKCVFLDADTLVLQNCDELFDREEFSAAPDVGWPDCFNSGVFVYRPSNDTYEKLIKFALEKGSFDGGDQGLLNMFFSDWAHKDISKHLPFIYNMCSTAAYSYLPAFMQFGLNAKIVHFIGNTKPWQQHFDLKYQRVLPSSELSHLTDVLQRWWNIFCTFIHPQLTRDMAENKVHPTSQYYTSQLGSNIEVQCTDNRNIDVDYQYREFVDPWEHYDDTNKNDSQINNSNVQYAEMSIKEDLPDINNEPTSSNITYPVETYNNHHHHHRTNINYYQTDEVTPKSDNKQSQNNSNFQITDNIITHSSNNNNNNNLNVVNVEQIYSSPIAHTPIDITHPEISITNIIIRNDQRQNQFCNKINTDSNTNTEQLIIDNAQSFNCTSSSTNTDWNVEQTDLTLTKGTDTIITNSTTTNLDAGLAGLFAQCTLGADGQAALQDHIHRQSWEVGNIDYLGRDSFDNIWSKICQTLGEDPTKKEIPVTDEVNIKEATVQPKDQETIVESSIPIDSTQDTVAPPPVTKSDVKDTTESIALPSTEVPKSAEPVSAITPTDEAVAAPAVVETAPVAITTTPITSEPSKPETPIALEPSKPETPLSTTQVIPSETIKPLESKEIPEPVLSTEPETKSEDLNKPADVPLPTIETISQPTEQKEKLQAAANATQLVEPKPTTEQPKEPQPEPAIKSITPAVETVKVAEPTTVESAIKPDDTKVVPVPPVAIQTAPASVGAELVIKPAESTPIVSDPLTEMVKQDTETVKPVEKKVEPKKKEESPKPTETQISTETTQKQVETTEKKAEDKPKQADVVCKKAEAECKKAEGQCKKTDCQKSEGECKKQECQKSVPPCKKQETGKVESEPKKVEETKKQDVESKKSDEELKVKGEEKVKVSSESSSKKGEGSKTESKKETKDGQTPTPPPRKGGSEGKKKSKK